MKLFAYLSLLILFSGAPGCSREPSQPTPAPEKLDAVASAVRTLTGARTRVAWLQDTGDGADYLARDIHLQLMGFDTDDEGGERVIVPAGTNIAKPMFTTDGNRIVFSDRLNGTMHIVDWDGGSVDELGEGFVLHTWRDPYTGIEWLYYAVNFLDDGKTLPTHGGIFRMGLPPYPSSIQTLYNFARGRLSPRRVWAQTEVSEDSYQKSEDGRFASAPFPWPHMGVHDIKARRWDRHGRGCWTAMAPDNSYLFWIFDGAHRNLIMKRIGRTDNERWAVRVNALSESDQYEVYHPRWSNHPRILAVSGPYKVGEGAYRLPGGGSDVEIHIGRFTDDHKAIEHWVRLTYNNFANFYPDVWVEPEPNLPPHERVAAIPPLEPEGISWPINESGLVYLWEHGGAQNEVQDKASGSRMIFRPEARGHARFQSRHEMWLDNGYFIEGSAPAFSDSFSIELLLHSSGSPSSSAPILSIGPQHGLYESNGNWLLMSGGDSVVLAPAVHEKAVHLVVSAQSNSVRAFINGREQSRHSLSNPIQWPSSSTLYFGGSPHQADWEGTLSHIALYARPIEEHEAEQHYRLIHEALGRHQTTPPEQVRARVLQSTSTPAPADIAPYRRGLVANEYEIIEGDGSGERIMVAHWVILDGKILEDAYRPVGSEYTLSITPYDERTELEGERLSMDGENFLLDLWYDLRL